MSHIETQPLVRYPLTSHESAGVSDSAAVPTTSNISNDKRVYLSDFVPSSSWEPDVNGPKYWYGGTPKYIIDGATGRRYLNESEDLVKYKCELLSAATPIVHTITGAVQAGVLLGKILTLSHFSTAPTAPTASEQWANAGKDLLRIVAFPVAMIGLECAAIYGIFQPYNARKIYTSIERLEYGDFHIPGTLDGGFRLAPCFQPQAQAHLLGGSIEDPNAI